MLSSYLWTKCYGRVYGSALIWLTTCICSNVIQLTVSLLLLWVYPQCRKPY